MRVSSSFILSAVKHILTDHLVSYALWELSVQPYLPFNLPPPSALLPVGICPVHHLPDASALPFLCYPRPAHQTPLTHYSTSLSKLPFLIKLSLFTPIPISFFPKHLYNPPGLMAVPYFLILDYITIIIFLYNIMISGEILPQRPLKIMNMPDDFFLDLSEQTSPC